VDEAGTPTLAFFVENLYPRHVRRAPLRLPVTWIDERLLAEIIQRLRDWTTKQDRLRSSKPRRSAFSFGRYAIPPRGGNESRVRRCASRLQRRLSAPRPASRRPRVSTEACRSATTRDCDYVTVLVRVRTSRRVTSARRNNQGWARRAQTTRPSARARSSAQVPCTREVR